MISLQYIDIGYGHRHRIDKYLHVDNLLANQTSRTVKPPITSIFQRPSCGYPHSGGLGFHCRYCPCGYGHVTFLFQVEELADDRKRGVNSINAFLTINGERHRQWRHSLSSTRPVLSSTLSIIIIIIILSAVEKLVAERALRRAREQECYCAVE